ncbi:adhesion G protein-coupled receptor E5-like, partial [Engraulis encrasicolus]|uniref:adhesion G protein-coupled receptor E5-like n=1 Tax=Engraulis encrasicolus TaxID=184585 RepID=UPI002FD5B0F0
MSTVTGYCEDDNECDTVPVYPSLCGEHAQCLNTKGSYYCECEEGYQSLKGPKFTADDPKCQDIDECKTVNICGLPSEGICSNTNGSYICVCKAEHSNYGNPQGRCTKITCDGYEDDGSKEQGGALGRLWGKMRANCKGLSSGQGKPDHSAAHGLLEDVLTATDDFLSSAGDMADSSKMTGLLTMMEKAMMLIGPQLKENKTTMETNYTEAELAVKRGKTAPTGHVELATDNASFKTNWETASGNGIYPGFTVAALVSYRGINSTPASSLESLKESLKEEMEAKSREEVQEEEEDNKGRRRVKVDLEMVSNVVTACVSNPDTHSLPEPVTFTFKHTNTPKQDQKKNIKVGFECVFWDGGVWSQRGCVKIQSNDTHTTCSCNHLSSFAVLMALYDIKHTFELRLLTWIGLAVSLFCLVLCILTFGFCRSIRGTRTTIHLHLSICLFMADLIFLCGISQAGQPGCGLVAALLHYFFLAAFAWMLLEGVQLSSEDGCVLVVPNSSLRLTGGSLEKWFIYLGLLRGRSCASIIPPQRLSFFLITLWRLAQKLSSLNPDLTGNNLQMNQTRVCEELVSYGVNHPHQNQFTVRRRVVPKVPLQNASSAAQKKRRDTRNYNESKTASSKQQQPNRPLRTGATSTGPTQIYEETWLRVPNRVSVQSSARRSTARLGPPLAEAHRELVGRALVDAAVTQNSAPSRPITKLAPS